MKILSPQIMFLTAFAIMSSLNAVYACEPPMQIEGEELDQPLNFHSNGSFYGAGAKDNFWADEVIKLKHHKTYQIIYRGEVCWAAKDVLFVDCKTGDNFVVQGSKGEFPSGDGMYRDIDLNLVVQGETRKVLGWKKRLTVKHKDTISRIADKAANRGFVVETNFIEETLNVLQKDKPDLFSGCKSFYPELPEIEV